MTGFDGGAAGSRLAVEAASAYLRGDSRHPCRLRLETRDPSACEDTMAWTTPTLIEICIGLEINGYLPAEF
jgi:coenzyme PQQ precursor peptide PqqA